MKIKSVKVTDNTEKFKAAEKAAAERALIIIGGKGEKYAKALCPVDTGNLRNSITNAMVDEKTVAIGTNVEYGPYVELGTTKTKAKPYLRPAIADHIQEFGHIIKSELKKA